MNAKELIEIARRAEFGLSYEEQAILGQYILSTVRRDDDEPVTRERLEADGCGGKKRKTPLGTVYYTFGTVMAYNPEKAELFLNGGSVGIKLKSMGHLRRLVAALGE